mgnify:CR=1 FL=1
MGKCEIMFKKIFFIVVYLYFTMVTSVLSDEIGVSAIVGNEVITNYDIDQRIKIISLTSGMVFNQNTVGTVRNQVRELLIIEKIQYLESQKYNLSTSNEEIEKIFNSVAKDNNMSEQDFEKFLTNRGIDIGSLKSQIKNSLNWQNLILHKIRPLVYISDYEIASYFESSEQGSDGYEYLVEIVTFPIANNKNVKKLVNKIYDKVQKGELSFSAVIKDFGKNTNVTEKKLWKYKKDFVEDIQNILSNLEIGDIATPIKIEETYYLVNLVNKRPALLNVTDEDYKDKIYKKLFIQKLEKKVQNYLKVLRKNSFVERKDISY